MGVNYTTCPRCGFWHSKELVAEWEADPAGFQRRHYVYDFQI